MFLISTEKLSYVIGYNINVMRQPVCLVDNPITVNNFPSLFNCTPIGRAADSTMGPKSSKSSYLGCLRLDLVLSVAWSFGVKLVVFFC